MRTIQLEEDYRSFKNFETFAVYNWLLADKGFQELLEDWLQTHDNHSGVTLGRMIQGEALSALKKTHFEMKGFNGLFHDLIEKSLEDIDWLEVGKAISQTIK